MKSILFIIVLLAPVFCFAQQPGGVEGAAFWLLPEQEGAHFILREKNLQQNAGEIDASVLLNGNPAWQQTNTNGIGELDLGIGDLSQLQIFTVYAPEDSLEEKAVWVIHDDQQDALLLTTHRLADFHQHKFMNNLGRKKHQPQINTYQRYIQQPAIDQYKITLGNKGLNATIPVTTFKGRFAEMIIYDRVLNSRDKSKVETYLALKYGIGIDKNNGASLYSSQNQKLWDLQQNFNFSNLLAGIGRDDGSGLYQKQSASIYAENIFSLTLNDFATNNVIHPGELSNQQYLIWGENGDNLQGETKLPGQIQKINKHWLLQSHDFGSQSTKLKFQTDRLGLEKAPSDIFWLVVDQSGKGSFAQGQTKYFPESTTSSGSPTEAFALFSDITWPQEQQVFTLAVGPALIPTLWVEAPECATDKSGTLHLAAVGGQPPYTFQVKNNNNQLVGSWESTSSETFAMEGIEPGAYTMNIRDSEGLSYTESFFINSKDATSSSLHNQYELPLDGAIVLDAGQGITDSEILFAWVQPNGQQLDGPEISITSPGEYLLNINHQGCLSQQKIRIKAGRKSNFKNSEVFPNPTTGHFDLTVDLFQAAELKLELINSAGVMLRTQLLPSNQFHHYQGWVGNPGFYFLKMTSRNSTRTQKIIVHH